ncbi:MAG: immune inhibitor A domain-containing protein [Thermoproteota archaeon]
MEEGGSQHYYLNMEGSWVEVKAVTPIDPSLCGKRVRITGTYSYELNAILAYGVLPVPSAPSPKNPTTGEQRTLVIAVKFSDITSTSHDLKYLQDLVFMKMDDYFREVSYNKTFFSGEVIGWYTLPREYSYYVNATSKRILRTRLEEIVHDTVEATDRDVYYPGYERIYLVFNGEFIPMGSVGLLTIETEDGNVKVSISWISEIEPLGVWVHETGHNLGLPDLYDTEGNEEFVGRWDPMAEGAWNHGGLSPAHFSSYGKLKLGWIPREQTLDLLMGQDDSIALEALEERERGFKVVRISLGENRYYLVEVRKKVGYDLYLPDSGVLLLYIDESIQSGKGTVRIVDSTPSTASLDDATFDIRTGKPRNWLNTTLKLTMIISGTLENGYEIRFSYGERVIIDLVQVSGIRVDVGSEQVIRFHALWERSGLPADVVIEVSGLHLHTNETGWATCTLSFDKIGRIVYNISSVETTLGIGVSFYQQAFPEIIWDRLVVEWGAIKNRIDADSRATMVGKVRYEYDSKPASGVVSISGENVSFISGSFVYEPPPVSSVTKKSYALTYAWGREYNISSFVAEPSVLDVVYDRVRVIFLTSTPRIEIGRNATVRYNASYEYDNSQFVGKIILNDEHFEKENVGRFSYKAVGIEDERYGLVSFTTNEVFVNFDRIIVENMVDAIVPGSVRVRTRLLFESDAQPVDKASVKVNGFLAKEVGTGVFDATIYTWNSQCLFTIIVERSGFSEKMVTLSCYSIGNIAIEVSSILIVAVAILLMRKKLSRKF